MLATKTASRAPIPRPTFLAIKPAAHSQELLETGLQQMAITGLDHPPGARKMALVNDLGAVRLSLRVESKKERDHLAPIRAFCIGVE